MSKIRKIPTGWWVAFGGSMLLAVLATLPPFLPEAARGILMTGFSNFCHQIPSRSPHVDGISMAACHRCMGIYYALGAASVLFLAVRQWDGFIRRHAGAIIVLSLVPLSVDWIVDVAGWWTNTPYSRFATGAVFGIAAGIYFTRAMVELFERKNAESDNVPSADLTRDIKVHTFH